MKITKTANTGLPITPAWTVTVTDTGGYFGGGGLTLEEILELIGAGSAPGAFLRSSGGEVHVIDTTHATLSGASTWDLANGNVHPGTLTADTSITTTGWPPAGKRGVLQWSIEGDGASTPTFAGVTWIDSAPGVIGAGDVLHGLLWSDDSGTVIYGAVAGGGGSGNFPGDVVAHGNLGATETLDYSAGTAHTGTLDANATVDFTGFTNLKDEGITFLVTEDGTGGHTLAFTGVSWLGGVTPTHDGTAGTSEVYAFISLDGGTTIIGGQLGAGSSGSVTAAELSALGVVGAIVMTPGITDPPEPVWTPDGTDYVYAPLG